MEKRKIACEFDRKVVDVLKSLVPGQSMELKEDGSGNMRIWKSKAVDVENMSIVTITRDSEDVAKVVYDYESGKEETFLY